MKFSGVFVVAEVWLTAKLKFSVVVGIDWICRRAFHPFQCFTRMWLLFAKRIFGVFVYSNLKGGLLDFLNSFAEVYWTFVVLISLNFTKIFTFCSSFGIAISSKVKLYVAFLRLSCSLPGCIKSFCRFSVKVFLRD